MAKFDVYENPSGSGYLLDVQADILDGLNTRMLVPLMKPQIAPLPAHRLNPAFVINGSDYVMVTQYMAATPKTSLGKPVANLSNHFAEVTNALDMLFQGY